MELMQTHGSQTEDNEQKLLVLPWSRQEAPRTENEREQVVMSVPCFFNNAIANAFRIARHCRDPEPWKLGAYNSLAG
eukprot:gene26180-biopygen14650